MCKTRTICLNLSLLRWVILIGHIYWFDAENVFSMQEDELISNESEAILTEDTAKGGEKTSENQLSVETEEGQEGELSATPCFFIYIFIFKCLGYASSDLGYMLLCQLMLLCLKPQKLEWPQRAAKMKSF